MISLEKIKIISLHVRILKINFMYFLIHLLLNFKIYFYEKSIIHFKISIQCRLVKHKNT